MDGKPKVRSVASLVGWAAVVALGVVCLPTAASAQPAKTVAVTTVETGPVVGMAMRLVWDREPNSSWYLLWVDDSEGVKIKQWVSAAEAGCDAVQSSCSALLPTDGSATAYSIQLPVHTLHDPLVEGEGEWWVRTWDYGFGNGPWSAAVPFTVRPPLTAVYAP